MFRIGLTAMVLLASVSTTARAANCNYYASPTGGGNGLSASSPFKVSNFWTVASAGKTLCLLDGTYTGGESTIVPPQGLRGASGAPITIRALNDGKVLISGQGSQLAVQLYYNDWFVIEGINACCTQATVVLLSQSKNNVVRRVAAWDAADNNTAIFAAHGGSFNLFEDVAGWGTARKVFSTSQGGDYTTFRRAWGRWERSTVVGPKHTYSLAYNSYHTTCEDCLGTWSGQGMPQTYTLKGYDGKVWTGNGAGTYTNYDVNQPYGIFSVDGESGDKNAHARLLGSLAYVLSTDNYKPSNAVSISTVASVEIKHTAAHIAPGTNLSVRPFGLYGPTGATNLKASNITSFGVKPSDIQLPWTKSNVWSASSPAGYGAGENIFNTGRGANLCYQYQNGNLTNQPLWPWPMNQRIKDGLIQSGRAGVDINATIRGIFGPIPAACNAPSTPTTPTPPPTLPPPGTTTTPSGPNPTPTPTPIQPTATPVPQDQAAGCDYYASPNGTGTGLAISSPFAISSFWKGATAGKTLCLLDGVYTGGGNMILPPQGLNGASGVPITIRALNDGKVLINGQGGQPPVQLYYNNWFVIEGINACCSNTYVVNLSSSSNNVVRRVTAWDAADNNSTIFGVRDGTYNLLEDVAGWGTARKIFSISQGGDYATIRRAWGRWERSTVIGPKMTYTLADNSYHMTCENCLGTWSGQGMPQTYTLMGYDGKPWTGAGAGTINNYLVNQPAGIFSASGEDGDKNAYARLLGSLAYILAADTYNSAQAVFLSKLDSIEIKDTAAYIAPGTHLSVHPFGLYGLPGATNLRASDLSSFGRGSSDFDSFWIRSNVWSGSSPASYAAGENIFNTTRGANLCYRYQDGNSTDKPLWPWSMNQRIIDAMVQSGRAPVDITATIQGFFGPIPAPCMAGARETPVPVQAPAHVTEEIPAAGLVAGRD